MLTNRLGPGVVPDGGYRLIRRRGRGGYAEVWEAEAPGGFRVALKFVRVSPGARVGELRAVRVIRGIRHPHLLPIFGAWEVDGLLVIGMELADRSLWDRFVEARAAGLGGVPRGELLGYLGDVADAVDYLNGPRHSFDGRPGLGVQHRDLKPQNLMLVGGVAKVADFGMVRVMEGTVVSHTGAWTLPYAAPEFFRGRTARQSDQYGLAVTYCQLRGGRLPFRGTAAEVMCGHLSAEPDLAAIPAPERPVVARALAKQPEDRWPDCGSFLEALRSLEDEALPDVLALQDPDEAERTADPFGGSGGDVPFATEWGAEQLGESSITVRLVSRSSGPAEGRGMVWVEGRPGRRGRGRFAAALLASGLILGASRAYDAPGRALGGAPPTGTGMALRANGSRGPGALSAGRRVRVSPGGTCGPTHRPTPEGEDVRVALVCPAEEVSPVPTGAAAVPEAVSEPADSPIALPPAPSPAGAAYDRGRDALRRGDYKRAVAELTDALRLDGAYPGAHFQRGLAEQLSGRYPLALADYNAAIRLRPDHAEAYLLRGRVHQELGAAALAASDLTEAIRLGPGDPAAYLARGRVFHDLGAYDRALADLTEAIRLRPDDPAAPYQRGLTRYHSGDLKGAVADFTAAIGLDPGHAGAYRARSEAYARLGDHARAAADRDILDRLVPRPVRRRTSPSPRPAAPGPLVTPGPERPGAAKADPWRPARFRPPA